MHAFIWSCHVVVRYNLFGLLAYSAKHRKSFFFFVAIFGWRSFGASLPSTSVIYTEIMMCGWKDCLCWSFWTSSIMNADFNVFNTCFTSSASVELEQRVFCRRSYQWMTAFTHGQLQNVLLTLHWHSPCETVAIDIAESLSFKIAIILRLINVQL